MVGGTNTRFIDAVAVEVGPGAPSAVEAADAAPPAVGAPYRWRTKSALLDNPNNGYT